MSLFLHQNRFGKMYHYITCSPVDPLQWMGAVRMRVETTAHLHNNPQIHIIAVHRYLVKQRAECLWEINSSRPFQFQLTLSEQFECKNILIDLFLTNMHLFFVQDDNDGQESYELLVDYCDVFIRYLDSNPDGPFTADDPLVKKWCIFILGWTINYYTLIFTF